LQACVCCHREDVEATKGDVKAGICPRDIFLASIVDFELVVLVVEGDQFLTLRAGARNSVIGGAAGRTGSEDVAGASDRTSPWALPAPFERNFLPAVWAQEERKPRFKYSSAKDQSNQGNKWGSNCSDEHGWVEPGGSDARDKRRVDRRHKKRP